jgi:hypothetical protein
LYAILSISKLASNSSGTRSELSIVSVPRKLECPICQTEVFDFGRTENVLAEQDDCSTSSSDVDDDTYDEYDEQELLVEFKKLISKHMKL